MTTTTQELRTITLRTLVEIAVQPKARREALMLGLDAHRLLTGEVVDGAYVYRQLAERYPDLVPGPTEEELFWEQLTSGKPRPVCIWHKEDARAYYEATEAERAAWNRYAQECADEASKDLDMGESLSAYTSVNRDGKIHSWAPPEWFPEWLKRRRGS